MPDHHTKGEDIEYNVCPPIVFKGYFSTEGRLKIFDSYDTDIILIL